MTGQLEAPQGELAEQVPGVEAVGGGVEAAVDPDRALGQAGPQGTQVGGVVDQATRLEVADQVHEPGRRIGLMVARPPGGDRTHSDRPARTSATGARRPW